MGKAENIVSDAIRAYLTVKGCIVYRMQSGRFRGAGGWITMNPEGTPDLVGMIPGGKFIAVEVKKPGSEKDTSLEQKAILEQINNLGGIAVVLDHYDEEELDDLLQEAWEN